MPDLQALAAIGLTIFALYLFSRERIPLESASLLVLVVIVLWFQYAELSVAGRPVTPRDLFSGFGHEALVTIACLLVLAKGLEITGALHPVAQWLASLWNALPGLAFLATMLLAAGMSMFLNNTPIVAIVLPLLVAMSLKAGIPASGILMPVGFATIIGGMATTIGTSTNLLVVSLAADMGVKEFGMFEFAPPVAMVGGVALLYLWLVAPRMLPQREQPMSNTAPRLFRGVLSVNAGGYADGRSLSEVLGRTRNRMRIEQVERGRDLFLARLPSLRIRAGDRLHVRDTAENLKEYERQLGATLFAAGDLEHPVNEAHPLQAPDQQLAEVVVTRGSTLHGRSLGASQVLTRHGLVPLAVYQPRPQLTRGPRDIAGIELRSGDVVLVQGSRRAIQAFKQSSRMLVLDGMVDLPTTRKAPIAVLVMLSVVVLAATGIAPISVAALTGAALMLLTGCLNWKSALEALDRRILLLIVASLALGLALMATGGADYIARLYVALTRDWSIAVALSGFILLMALLTEVATNNAIAVLGTPIAVSVAQQLGAPVEPFVLGVLFGANMSYMTPVGYQTNLLVMSAGGYRFSDFFRVGLPLQLIMWLGLSFALQVIYL